MSTRRKPDPIAKLDPFKDYILERLRAAAPDETPAVVLFREIRQRGYRGGETRVKDFVRSLQPSPQPDPVVHFETGPSQQMQANWTSIRGGKNRFISLRGNAGLGAGRQKLHQPSACPALAGQGLYKLGNAG